MPWCARGSSGSRRSACRYWPIASETAPRRASTAASASWALAFSGSASIASR